MSGFLMAAACKGKRPKRFEGRRIVSRPELVARLLGDRSVARFIVAPTAFGKTSLMLEYAEVVFSFRHTFWVNCKSPCFLRDLDAGAIVEGIRRIDSERALVVFDDVPGLGTERADAFSAAVDDLLSAGNEVIVSCAPPNDAYAHRHRDRVALRAGDLLLSDDEAAGIADAPAEGEDSLERHIASVAWGNDDGSAVLSGMVADEPSASMLLFAFLVLSFGSGSLDDVRPYLSEAHAREAAARAEEDYPFLGVSTREGSYRAACIDAAALSRACAKRADDMAVRSTCSSANELARRVADDLIGRDACGRACAIMASLAAKPACAEWLAERGSAFFRKGCFKAPHELFSFAGKRPGAFRVKLIADEAVRLLVLDDARTAAYLAQRLALSRAVAPDVRASMLCVVALAKSPELSCCEQAVLRELSHGKGKGERGKTAGQVVGRSVSSAALPASGALSIARFAHALNAGGRALVDESLRFSRSAGDDAFAAAGALVSFSAAARAFDAKEPFCVDGARRENALPHEGLERLASWSIGMLEKNVQRVPRALGADAPGGSASEDALCSCMPWLSLRLAAALSRAIESGALPACFSPNEQIAAAAHRSEVALFAERAAYRRDAIREERAAIDRSLSCEERYDAASPLCRDAQASHVPLLYVGLFGGLDVRIGGVPVDAAKFSRQKTKTLLTLLVLNRGRELSRSRLLSTLWPHLQPEAAQKSFYTVWSQLRHALEFDGSCPYLVRDQGGVRIASHLLETDVADFERICRSLSFGAIDVDAWQAHLTSLGEDFAEELLPSETDNDYIASVRRRYRSDLIDALVSAASRLAEAGESRASLWFAREAVRRDGTREDAYAALMQAQIDAGQRSGAIDTYFRCRRYLADELGIDPSVALVSLYRSIIESVEEFA